MVPVMETQQKNVRRRRGERLAGGREKRAGGKKTTELAGRVTQEE
jgi:hypothetical protein